MRNISRLAGGQTRKSVKAILLALLVVSCAVVFGCSDDSDEDNAHYDGRARTTGVWGP
jgi:hypothetical protein